MSLREADSIANMLKAVGHPVRLAIIRELANCGTRCCGEVCDCFSLSQSTVSQHLSVLKDAGVLIASKEGNKSRYQLNAEALAQVMDELKELTTLAGNRCQACND